MTDCKEVVGRMSDVLDGKITFESLYIEHSRIMIALGIKGNIRCGWRIDPSGEFVFSIPTIRKNKHNVG